MQYVKVDLSGLERYAAVVQADLRGGGNGPIRAGLRQWGGRFRAFLRERFVEFSRGGGDWPDLADSTKKARMHARAGARDSAGRLIGKGAAKGRTFAILRDTGTLLNALDVTFSSKPGQLQEDIPFGVRVGYGGPGRYPNGKATIADIASFHQTGGPHLPCRKIIVDPLDKVKQQMASDMQKAVDQMAREANH